MSPYEILQISSVATNDEVISAHAKLHSLAARLLADKPDLYKLRKHSLDSAKNRLLDLSKRAEIDKSLALAKNAGASRAINKYDKSILRLIMYPFSKLFELLWFVFGPAAKYLAKIGIVALRVSLFVFIIWSAGFASYTEPYRKVALSYAGVIYNDFGSIIPEVNFREYLPGFLGGRYTYNSLACEKIRIKIAYMEKILKEEREKSGALKTFGFGVALAKLVQGDTAKAKEYAGETSRSTSRTDNEIRMVKVQLDRQRVDNLECTKKPT
mgnify:CR=1 FL=1